MDWGLLLALAQSGLGLVAYLILRGRRAEHRLSPSQVEYREKIWGQYLLLTLVTSASLALHLWSLLMAPAWRLQHLGLCLTLPVLTCLCLVVWLVVSVPVLLRRYNYLTDF